MALTEFTQQLSNCKLTRLDVDLSHHYYGDGDYFVSLTHILDIGAPFPEGLRQYLRMTDAAESEERLTMTADRGTKLHKALEGLAKGLRLYLEDFPTTYEKDAIVTFIRCMRFLYPDGLPKGSEQELIAADKKLRVGGTMDFVGIADKRRLDILINPRGRLKLEGDDFVPIKPLEGRKQPVKFIKDYKFTGRNTYNHKVQASKYREMYNLSYAKAKPAARAYTWRYSSKHKLKFDMNESLLKPSSFNRIYKTAMEYLGKFPEAPTITVYPESVQLFEPTNKKGLTDVRI